jgi:hypothetical protein
MQKEEWCVKTHEQKVRGLDPNQTRIFLSLAIINVAHYYYHHHHHHHHHLFRTYYLSTDSYVKFVGQNLKVFHHYHIFNQLEQYFIFSL